MLSLGLCNVNVQLSRQLCHAFLRTIVFFLLTVYSPQDCPAFLYSINSAIFRPSDRSVGEDPGRDSNPDRAVYIYIDKGTLTTGLPHLLIKGNLQSTTIFNLNLKLEMARIRNTVCKRWLGSEIKCVIDG